eukprot:1318723-Amorphochlora_amoeboformis.AAC.1
MEGGQCEQLSAQVSNRRKDVTIKVKVRVGSRYWCPGDIEVRIWLGLRVTRLSLELQLEYLEIFRFDSAT